MKTFQSRNELISYIKSMLGQPIIIVELSDEQINYIIDDLIAEEAEKTKKEFFESVYINSISFRQKCIAHCGELWARILCKYKSQPNNDISLNAEFLYSIFQEKISQLNTNEHTSNPF